MTMLVALHALAAVVWVGGMFFAYMVLRPSAGPLEPPLRLALWPRVFGRFFPWVWASIAVLLVSGYAMLFLRFGGFAGAGLHIHVMQVDRHSDDAVVLASLLRAVAPVFPRRRNGAHCRTPPLRSIRSAASSRSISCSDLITVAVGASGRFWP